ncbi:hypothetical protein HFP43_24465 [Streptomyces sp. SJ1-7]|nr:hypothetical protein [Streptomyces sp. SJ1-7]
MAEGDLHGAVQQQEAERGDGRGPVDALADDSLPGGEKQPVGGQQAPGDGSAERHQRQDAGGEIEGGAEAVAPRDGEQGTETRAATVRPPCTGRLIPGLMVGDTRILR